MTRIKYPKDFDRYKYLSKICSAYVYISKNELLKKIIPKLEKDRITLKVLFEYFKSNKIGEFDILFKNISFEALVIGRFKIIEIIKTRIKSSKEIKENKYLAFVFNYSNLQRNKIKPFFEDNLLISSCYYCNIDFINTYNTRSEKKNKFTLDHYFDKSTYPYLALSLYNLIPSCYACNSKLKRVIEFKNLAPSSTNYDFNERVKFKITLEESCKNLHIKNKNDINIYLKENYTNEFEKFIKDMYLNERYKAHKDIVYEMITKAERYPESRLKELQNLTGIPFQQIKKDIFNLIDENEDLSKKPFSKLIKDISEELGLTK
jgi:hypothetical protein